jgi:MFS family permease
MLMRDRSINWVLGAVFSTSLGVGLIFGFEPPLIAMVLNRSGNSSFVVGAVIAVSLVAVSVIGPLYPYAIARLGLRRSVMCGISAAVLILLVMPFWNSVAAWVLLRVATGSAFGLSWIASEIWMNTVSGDASRGTVMGIYGTVFSIGTVAGPVLLELTGTSGPLPFMIGALCLALTLLPLALLRDAARSSATHATQAAQPTQAAQAPPPRLAAIRKLFGFLPAAPIVMLAAAVAGLVESADLSLLPLFGLHAGLNERTALLLVTVFLVGNVALQLPIGLLADRFGRRAMLGVCALTSAIGPLLLPAVLDRPTLLWPLLFVWGGTLYAFYSQGVALLGEQFQAGNLAGANTLFVMIYCVGGVLGPSVGGYAMDVSPHRGLPLVLSIAAASLLAGLAFSDRSRAPAD